jgi:hypothetical protein
MAAKQEWSPQQVAYAAEVQAVLERAQQGQIPRAELQAFLDTRPDIWRQVGDLAFHARHTLLNMMAGKDLLCYESVHRRMKELEAELAGSSPSPIERLLAERAAIDWAGAYFADMVAFPETTLQDILGIPAEQKLKRQESSHRRLLRSLKVLADVKRLTRPNVVQIVGRRKLAGPHETSDQERIRRGSRHRLVCADA